MKEHEDNFEQAVNRFKAENTDWKVNQKKRLTINHAEAANAMIKTINSAPEIPHVIKQILTLRIGAPFFLRKPMSHMQIAINLGLSFDEVVILEKEGLLVMKDILKQRSLMDGVLQFNKDGNFNKVKQTFIDGQRSNEQT